jgi:hypothetical protein
MPIRLLTFFMTQRISTMLTLYAFFIFLSSSVIAAPHPPPPPITLHYEETMTLKGNTVEWLTGKWSRQMTPTHQEMGLNTWTRAQDCDDILEVENHGTTINIYRLKRWKHEVDGKDRYSLLRTIEDHNANIMTNAAMTKVYEHVPEAKWDKFLYRTYWA